MTPVPERAPGSARGFLHHVPRQLGLLVPGLDDIRRHRPLLAPLLLIGLFSLAAMVSLRPLLEGAFTAAGIGAAARGVEAWLWVAAIFSPLLMGGKALILAGASWSLIALLGRDVAFRPLLSIYLYGEALLSLQGVAAALVLHLGRSGSVSSPEELYVPMGLEELVPPGSDVLAALARGGTAFHLAWFVFLAVALVRVVGLSRGAGAGAAAASWLLVLSVTGLRALALG